ncbi:uncharacterized protein UV8b_07641 [Ustilaginoidea virens]|uniref:Uncharacterized protein n=1 Tax=Ustilaginoidea virens TaxID=1159556 RepID=A0A8E5HXV8_USTVR|nr:uncharacterized protein UV8b_07641 [Ustilaginoidea virens]QUC23400.1 hypothetical protein UV8b_07641 [Ustilaginoidea virens]
MALMWGLLRHFCVYTVHSKLGAGRRWQGCIRRVSIMLADQPDADDMGTFVPSVQYVYGLHGCLWLSVSTGPQARRPTVQQVSSARLSCGAGP